MLGSAKGKKCFYCYKIKCSANGKGYIGIAVGSPKKRFNQHKHDAKKGVVTPLHQAIRKHGIEKFSLEVLAETSSWEKVCELERKFIKDHNTLAKNGKGYNVATGGQGPFGVERSVETREKLRRITKKWLSEDPDRLRRLIDVGRKQAADPQQREISKRGAQEAWQQPGYREKVSARVKSWAVENRDQMKRNQREVMARPGVKENLRRKAKAQMQDPNNRELSRQGALLQWKNESFRHKMKAQMQEVGRRNWRNPRYREKMRSITSKSVVAAGIRYKSLEEAAQAVGIRPNSLIYRLKNERYPDYYYLPLKRYVVIGGIRYASINAAAKALDISHPVCLRRIRSPDFPEYQIVEEIQD